MDSSSKEKQKPKQKPKEPRGKTFTCDWCGDRVPSSHWLGCYDADTGKPVCAGCESCI